MLILTSGFSFIYSCANLSNWSLNSTLNWNMSTVVAPSLPDFFSEEFPQPASRDVVIKPTAAKLNTFLNFIVYLLKIQAHFLSILHDFIINNIFFIYFLPV